MAQTLPVNIPIPASAAIASFNYTDIAEGTGVVKFYGATHANATTTSYYLTSATPYSNDIVTSGGGSIADTDHHRVANNNFDVTFNRAQNIKGYAYLNLTMGSKQGGAGTTSVLVFVSGATLQNATTGTTLATASGAIVTFSDSVTIQSQPVLIRFDLTGGPYHFKPTETLRLNLQLWARKSGVASVIDPGYGHDPANRAEANLIESGDPTTLTLYVPFLLNNT